jgi:prephenate dehydrogenase
MSLRRFSPETGIRLWGRRAAAVEEALGRGVADVASTDPAEVVPGADLVLFCVPVGAMPALAERVAPLLDPGALVTDVGSVKAPVVAALEPVFGGRFVGSHPMAGSEKSGIGAARADLFRDAVSIITPGRGALPDAVAAVRAFWELLGSRVRELSPEEHDRTVALVSHLPHLLAAALVDFVCSENRDALNFCGAGFRDTTRVASGPAGMWAEILTENREAMRDAVRSFAARVSEIERLLDSPGEIEEFLARAAAERDAMGVSRPNFS